MASFVLIHGAWHGGWCFDALRPLLQAHGHRIFAPDLPGMGGDTKKMGKVTLAGWADFVIDQCRAVPPPVILCGHSRGGIVISTAAERAPEGIAALVYITAFLVPSGESLASIAATGLRASEFASALSFVGNVGSRIDPMLAPALFFQDAVPSDAALASARLVTEPTVPMSTPLELSEARFGSIPRHYIECLDDRVIDIGTQRRMHGMLPCATVTTLASGHSPFLSMPEQLAERLIAIAQDIEN